jgi:hypothetical protein
MPNWQWESEASPLELFSYPLDIDCFTQTQLSDMAHFLRAKGLHSFVANQLMFDTEVDLFIFDMTRGELRSHCRLIKLY